MSQDEAWAADERGRERRRVKKRQREGEKSLREEAGRETLIPTVIKMRFSPPRRLPHTRLASLSRG